VRRATPAITEGDHSELLESAKMKPASSRHDEGGDLELNVRGHGPTARSDLSLQRLILQHSFGTSRMLALRLLRGKYTKKRGV
jgi:hypothetical protein